MDYGELRVFLADGTLQTFTIEKETTAIGRSPGNDVVLPTPSASRYHAHIIVGEGRAELVDLGTVNGTFIDDQVLQSDGRIELTGDEEIRIGDVMLVFRPGKDLARPDTSQAEETHVALSTETRDLRILLEEPSQAVAPGARMQLILTLENPHEQSRLCTVELSGMDSKWAKANRYEVQLEGFEKTEVLISVHPPRGSETLPGQYKLTVMVTLHDDPQNPIEYTRTINVVEYHGFGMVVEPGKRPGSFRVYVQNQGNVPAKFELDGWHAEDSLTYDFSKARLNLKPGETQEVTLRVKSGQKEGSPDATTFAVVAHSLDASGFRAAVPVVYNSQSGGGGGALARPMPLIGGLIPGILAGLGSLLVLTGLAGLLFFSDDFGSNRSQPPLPTEVPTSPVITTEAPTATSERTPFPAPASVVAAFDPPEVVRYQDSSVILRYAVETQPGPGPEELSFTLIDETSQTPLGQFTVIDFRGGVEMSVLMGSSWLAEVYEDNDSLTYSLRVSVRDSSPTLSPPVELAVHSLACSLPAGIQIRSGPGNNYPPTAPPVSADEVYWPTLQANVNDILWYRIGPGEGERWVLATDLRCTLNGQLWQPEANFQFLELDAIPPTSTP